MSPLSPLSLLENDAKNVHVYPAKNVRFEGGPGSSWMSKQHCRGGSKNLRNKAQFDTISSHGILKPSNFMFLSFFIRSMWLALLPTASQ